MTDQLGVCTRYGQHELTHLAIQLANMAIRSGIKTTLLARNSCRRNVSPFWDSKVIDERKVPFARWAPDCSRIIWTALPSLDELVSVKELGITAAAIINWEELLPEHLHVVKRLDKVIIPYRCVGYALQKHWKLDAQTCVVMPWDLCMPCTCKDQLATVNSVVFFPLYDSQPQRADQAIFQIMRNLLNAVKEARIVVGVGCGWAMAARKTLEKLRRTYKDRVSVLLRPGHAVRMEAFAASDLAAWAPRFESLGLVGLMALHMGTPVITWDMRPVNEYMSAWKNCVLVPCKTQENWLGVPEAIGDYTEFNDMLISTVRDKALLSRLRRHTDAGFAARRKQFDAGWLELLA